MSFNSSAHLRARIGTALLHFEPNLQAVGEVIDRLVVLRANSDSRRPLKAA